MMETIVTKKGTWMVDTSVKNIIGNGAYGIVYRGTDEKGNKVAAKRIDTKQREGLDHMMKDLEKLMTLDHPNIVRIRDIHEETGVVWVFMDFCEHGDLTTFFRKAKMTQEQIFSIMKQIASGVAYLHENNIIHRDIKPENILVADASEIQVKLTDFDISKFLDAYFDTSAMSSVVGTLAYKAPEVFQTNPDGKVIYHRTVDVYSSGLTFLALGQSQGKEKLMLPQIETPRDASEFHTRSIGQLIAERIKYKVPELNVVRTTENFCGVHSAPAGALDTSENNTTVRMKEIIQNMTKAKPEDRWPAAKVLHALQSIDLEKVGDQLSRIRLEEKREASEVMEHVHERKATDLKLNKTVLWETGSFHANTMCIVENQILVQGMMDQKVYIRVFNRNDGRCIRNIKSMCGHANYYNALCGHYKDSKCILEACSYCNQIRSYNIESGEVETIHTGNFRTICRGPLNSLLEINLAGSLAQLTVDNKSKELKVEHSVQTGVSIVRRICYVEQNNIVVLSCKHPFRLVTVSLGDGSPLWEFKGQVEGKDINPYGLCHDNDGRIYVIDRDNKRLIVLGAQTGELLQVVPITEALVYDVCWTNNPSQITVVTNSGQSISFSNSHVS